MDNVLVICLSNIYLAYIIAGYQIVGKKKDTIDPLLSLSYIVKWGS